MVDRLHTAVWGFIAGAPAGTTRGRALRLCSDRRVAPIPSSAASTTRAAQHSPPRSPRAAVDRRRGVLITALAGGLLIDFAATLLAAPHRRWPAQRRRGLRDRSDPSLESWRHRRASNADVTTRPEAAVGTLLGCRRPAAIKDPVAGRRSCSPRGCRATPQSSPGAWPTTHGAGSVAPQRSRARLRCLVTFGTHSGGPRRFASATTPAPPTSAASGRRDQRSTRPAHHR